MLTPKATDRANILDICSHWWINEGYDTSCLDEAEHLANLTPVRLDLLLSLAKAENKMPLSQETNNNEVIEILKKCKSSFNKLQEAKDGKQTPSVDIEEIPADTPIPDGMEECDVSLSEEPPDEKSPKARKKKEHKRKHDNSTSNGEVAKKHERQENHHAPAPTHGPEPMEILETEIYERTSDKKQKSCELLDESRTPRSRRKKSSKDNVPDQEMQKRPPQKPKSPKPDNSDQNSDITKKVVKKKKHHVENGEPFERPEPRASPRPPRTPVPSDIDEVLKQELQDIPPTLTIHPEEKAKAQDDIVKVMSSVDNIPPPLPEKKHKSPKASQSRKNSKEDEYKIVGTEIITNNSSFNNDSEFIGEGNENKNELLKPKIISTNMNLDESCNSSVKSNSSVIDTKPFQDHIDKEIVIEEIKCEESPIQARQDASSIIQTQSLKLEESASGELNVSADFQSDPQPSQLSVQNVGTKPEQCDNVTQAQDQNVSPNTDNINTELANSKKNKESVQPLVKPFPSQPTNTKPLEFPPKTAENSSIKPPWVKTDNKIEPKEIFTNKSQEYVTTNRSSNEVSKPSINNLPKLVKEKSSEPAPLSPALEKVSLSEQTFTDQTFTSAVFKHDESSNNQETKQPPLVVPFPGRQIQAKLDPALPSLHLPEAKLSCGKEEEKDIPSTVLQPVSQISPNSLQTCHSETLKQESPKYVLNNIPKPFKPEIEKSDESVNEAVTLEADDIILDKVLTEKSPVASSISVEKLETAPGVSMTPSKSEPLPQTSEKVLEPLKIDLPPKQISEIPQKDVSGIHPREVPEISPRQHPSLIPIPMPSEPRKQEPRKIQIIMKNSKAKSTDSIGSSKSVSSIEEKRDKKSSSPNSPMVTPKPNGPNINLSLLSPSNSGSNIPGTPEKRDSKVIKAAAYWNNFIGEVTAKSRPPSNPKLMEKPKKIVSAGIGEKGLKDLTTAFESGKPIEKDDKYTILRRNSKKSSNVESCNPGLRVNEAKSQFEKKFMQQAEPSPTPSMRRRASGTLDKPETPTPKNSDVSKSPSPIKAEKAMTLPQPLNKQKSPELDTLTKMPETPKLAVKSKQEIQRNTIVNDVTNNLHERSKEQENESKRQDVSFKQESLTLSKDQPKPPTSPKPKIRKEELKQKEELVKSKDEKPVVLAKKVEDVQAMVAPITPTGIELLEQAKVVKTKEIVEKDKSLEQESTLSKKADNRAEMQIQVPPSKSILKTKHSDNEAVTSPTTGIYPQIQQSKETTIIKFNNEGANDIENKPQVKIVKIKSPEPSTIHPQEPKLELADIRSSLKKVPHIAVARRKSNEEEILPSVEASAPTEKRIVKTEIVIPVTNNNEPTETEKNYEQPFSPLPQVTSASQDVSNKEVDGPKERIIPIQFINENSKPRPFKLESTSRPQTPVELPTQPEMVESPRIQTRKEHHIPIHVESSSSKKPEEDLEHSEKLDNFNASSISRRRWGSRKKRMSSAFSDSSMSEDEAMSTPFGGLQKYTSYGKHCVSQGQEPYQLRKTRPPFSVTRTDSFSSGEDDLEDDGFQEMTAENLFSTLLSRVKSLTRRIHDEHEEHLLWQQKQRLGPPKLNPGGTHARLERTAQRNSIKRDRDSAMATANSATRTPAAYSRQSSSSNYPDESLTRSYGNNSAYGPTKIYNRSNSYNSTSNNNTMDSERYSTGSRFSTLSGSGPNKRYDETETTGSDFSSNISVTSSQRLRPGYLPPPVTINSDNNNHASIANRTSNSANANEIDAHTVAQTIINRAHDKTERSIPISIQRENTASFPSPSDTGTSLQSSGGYTKSFNTNNSNRYDESQIDDGHGGRRVSRFLRPDFYDIPKEDSVYAKMRDWDDDGRNYLRASAGSRSGKSGRSTPLDQALTPQYCDTSLEAAAGSTSSEGQFQNRTPLTLTRRNSLREPTSRLYNSGFDSGPLSSNPLSPSPLPLSPSPNNPTSYSRINYTTSELPVENAQLYRRQIRPYTGAKSEGHLQATNQHANVSLNVIAAAERKKRQSQSYSLPASVGPEQEAMNMSSNENMS